MTSHKSTPVADIAWTDQERELLSAARRDHMPSHLEARLREALELQLGGASVSGSHAAAQRASSPSSQSGDTTPPPHPAVAQPPVGALERSARASQLFASKLPLWGVLTVVALGSFVYAGLRSSASPSQLASSPLSAAEPARDPTPTSVLLRQPQQPSDEARPVIAVESGREQAPDAARCAPVVGAVDVAASGRAEASSVRGADGCELSVASQSRNADRAPGAVADVELLGAGVAAVGGGERASRAAGSADGAQVAAFSEGRDARVSGAPLGVRGSIPRSPLTADVGSRSAARVAERGHSAARGSVASGASLLGDAAKGGGVSALPVSGAKLGAVDALRMEAELLDGARLALSRGALQEARLLLGRYSAQFERGVLLPERDVLGIELEMRTGSERAAASHAASFLASYPLHPLRERVRELVANASQRAATAAE